MVLSVNTTIPLQLPSVPWQPISEAFLVSALAKYLPGFMSVFQGRVT